MKLMLNNEILKEGTMNIKRRYTVADVFFGKTANVGLAFQDGRAIEVADRGCCGANKYKYADEREMLYYYDNHAKKHFPQILNKA